MSVRKIREKIITAVFIRRTVYPVVGADFHGAMLATVPGEKLS